MKLRLVLYLFLFLFTRPAYSQKWAERGHQQFQELAYSAAIVSLEKAVEEGYATQQIYTELADASYFNARYQAAAQWYQLAFQKRNQLDSVQYLRFAQSLKSIGKQEEAQKLLETFTSLQSNINSSFLPEDTILFQDNKIKNSGRFQIKLAHFNSTTSDFSPAYLGSQIVFASARDTGSVFKRNHSWTNQPFTNLYIIQPDSVSARPVAFSKNLETKFNESSAVFTKDGLVAYFTRNNFDGKKRGYNQKQNTLLKIYKAIKSKGKWKLLGALPFCSDHYNVAHPALSADEQTLYFASDKEGGFGQSDLYQVAILSPTGLDFGVPENLGATINSIGRETFPFISAQSALYFASDGRDGFGGLDIYVSDFNTNQHFSYPQNVGAPVNSSMDDFGFIINSEDETGYFTSNRLGGVGMDDIYTFKELYALPCETVLSGNVVVQEDDSLLSEVEIHLLDGNLAALAITNPDECGNYHFIIDCKDLYFVQTVLRGYDPQQMAVRANLYAKTTLDQILIEKKAVPFQIGDDLGQKLQLQPIYFDLGKSWIRQDAVIELSKIKEVLEAFPSLAIQVRSHTDSRDSSANNQILSDKRAQATLDWFLAKGIPIKRLSGKGFGETQMVNNCTDSVPCSEMQHQQNRRSEFIITGI